MRGGEVTIDFSTLLFLDFEARSEVSIVDVGAHVYAEHPSTGPLCCAWCVGDGEVQLWKMGEPEPTAWWAYNLTFVAHNKDTEKALLLHKFGISHERWIDTASLVSAAGLPRKLRDAAKALKLPVQKIDSEDFKQLWAPRRPSKENKDRFWTPETRPELFQRMYDYCARDTDLLRHILRALPDGLRTERELRLEQITDRANWAGVKVDLRAVGLAQGVVEAHGEALRRDFEVLMPGLNPRSPVRVAAALSLPNVEKATVREALKACNGEESPRRSALEILKTIKTASTAKLDAFRLRTSADGRLRGAIVFHGAGRTGRWASMGVQLHNLIRGLASGSVDWPAIDELDGADDRAFGALEAGVLADLYENPTRVVASMMKGFLVGPFLVGDLAQIEARALNAWAGQADVVLAFKLKQDPYKNTAARIYGLPVDQINKHERFMGKQAELGCGYGIGPGGFTYMLKSIYDVDVDEVEAKRIVDAYRRSHPRVVALWYAVDRMAKACVIERWSDWKQSREVPKIAMRMHKSWMQIRLPTGRFLWYFEPAMEDGELKYWGRNPKKGGAWERIKTYGGKIVENVTQAMARDVMADAMIRLDDRGLAPCLTVHDEVVSEQPEELLSAFEEEMKRAPAWWPDLPLDADVQWTERYTK